MGTPAAASLESPAASPDEDINLMPKMISAMTRRPRRQLQSDHFDGTSLHDHCYIQSEKIITRNEQFIGQQNLSILKFHQSIRGLSRDKFTRGSGLVFFNEI